MASLQVPGCDASAPQLFRDTPGPACAVRGLLSSTAGVAPQSVIFTDVCCVPLGSGSAGGDASAGGEFCVELDLNNPANDNSGCGGASTDNSISSGSRRLLRTTGSTAGSSRALQGGGGSLALGSNLRVSSRIRVPANKAALLLSPDASVTASQATDECATCTSASAIVAARLAALTSPSVDAAANVTTLLGRIATSWAATTGFNVTQAALAAVLGSSLQAVPSAFADKVPPNFNGPLATVIATVVVVGLFAAAAVLFATMKTPARNAGGAAAAAAAAATAAEKSARPAWNGGSDAGAAGASGALALRAVPGASAGAAAAVGSGEVVSNALAATRAGGGIDKQAAVGFVVGAAAGRDTGRSSQSSARMGAGTARAELTCADVVLE